jgi:hypothetical protein
LSILPTEFSASDADSLAATLALKSASFFGEFIGDVTTFVLAVGACWFVIPPLLFDPRFRVHPMPICGLGFGVASEAREQAVPRNLAGLSRRVEHRERLGHADFVRVGFRELLAVIAWPIIS